MKRSKAVRLVLVGSTPLMLAGCDQPQTGYVYENVPSCISARIFSSDVCQHEYDLAKAVHQQNAPTYPSNYACETDFGAGRCEQDGNLYVPTMAGYLIGREFQPCENCEEEEEEGEFDLDRKKRKYKRTFTSQPLYRAWDDYRHFRTPSNERIGRLEGRVQVKSDATRAPDTRMAVARGGFGARAGSYSSFGG